MRGLALRMAKIRMSTLSPAVKRLVLEHGVDPQLIVATGPKHNILKGDVLSWISKGGGKGEGIENSDCRAYNSTTSTIITDHSLSAFKQLSRDTITTMMLEELLCKAIIYAAELKGVIRIIKDDLERSINAKGPLSHFLITKSGSINIFINLQRPSPTTSVPNIAIIRRKSHYLVQFNNVALKMDHFNERLSACLSEPYTMLL